MPMISYAQNGEDVVLNRLFPGDRRGFYIDVGANDPVRHSVTKHFYDLGWRGVNIEPQPEVFARLRDARPLDVNLNCGLSDRAGRLPFYDVPDSSGWSTFSEAQARNVRDRGLKVVERSAPVLTLAEVCDRHADRPIDFLKVDAESHEREVLRGGDWARWRPGVVVVEAGGMADWEPILLGADYLFALFDGINRYYIRAEDRHLLPGLATMANAVDDYISYEHALRIDALRALSGGLSPRSLALARRARDACRRVPGLSGLLRKILPAA